MKTVNLSQTEKDLINRMNHPMYTVSFIESWLNRPPANVYSNAPTALQQCMVEGFMEAVKTMAALEGRELLMDDLEKEAIRSMSREGRIMLWFQKARDLVKLSEMLETLDQLEQCNFLKKMGGMNHEQDERVDGETRRASRTRRDRE